MKSGGEKKNISIDCYGVSAFVFIAIGLLGTCVPSGEELGYGFLAFYVVMPFTAMLGAFVITMKRGRFFWLYPVFYGFLGIMIPYFLYHSFVSISLYFAGVPAVIGFLVGVIANFGRMLKER